VEKEKKARKSVHLRIEKRGTRRRSRIQLRAARRGVGMRLFVLRFAKRRSATRHVARGISLRSEGDLIAN